MMSLENWQSPKIYAVKHKDDNVRAASRSGGIFTALSDFVLDNGGVVYGCVLTNDFKAVHVRAEDKVSRDLMRGSKYIQSKLGDTFRRVKIDLDSGKRVLFSGTSCQVAGLRGFLGKEHNNLLCIDIVCHGVPSTVIWESYLRWQERKAKAKVKAANFRNKADFGWRDHVETLTMDSGKSVSSRVFVTLYYGSNPLRPSCYECPFKSINRPGDISIADYWKIEKAAPEFDDNKGVSLVLVNNGKGADVFERIKDYLTWKQTRIEDSMQKSFIEPYAKPESREQFWRDFQDRGFGYIARKYGGNGLLNKAKRNLRGLKRGAWRMLRFK